MNSFTVVVRKDVEGNVKLMSEGSAKVYFLFLLVQEHVKQLEVTKGQI